MPGKIARSNPRPSFGPPVVLVAAGSSRLVSREAENRYYSRQFGSHLGNPGSNKFFSAAVAIAGVYAVLKVGIQS